MYDVRPRTGGLVRDRADRGHDDGSRVWVTRRSAAPRIDACLIRRINNSYEPINAAEGQAVISRPTADGSATATFADELAELPITNSTHGNTPERCPSLEEASSDIDDATIIPSTDTGNNAAVQDVSPYRWTSANICL